jgi:NADH-quinone oxidoreductase subunit E
MTALTDAIRAKIVDACGRYPNKQAVTLPALHWVQQEQGCVSKEAIEGIAELLDLSAAQVIDTMTFYGFFKDEKHPLGRRRIWVCRSLSCMLRGGDGLLAEVCQRLGVQPGQTTADGGATIELAECLGACDGAPCILIDDSLSLHATADQVVQLAKEPS